MADETMKMARCVQQPQDVTWADQPDEVILEGVAAGIAEAMAEAEQRWPRRA